MMARAISHLAMGLSTVLLSSGSLHANDTSHVVASVQDVHAGIESSADQRDQSLQQSLKVQEALARLENALSQHRAQAAAVDQSIDASSAQLDLHETRESVQQNIILASVENNRTTRDLLGLVHGWLQNRQSRADAEKIHLTARAHETRAQILRSLKQQSRLRDLSNYWQERHVDARTAHERSLMHLALIMEADDLRADARSRETTFSQHLDSLSDVTHDATTPLHVDAEAQIASYVVNKWKIPPRLPVLALGSHGQAAETLQVSLTGAPSVRGNEAVDSNIQPVISGRLVISAEDLKPYREGIQYFLQQTEPVRAPASGTVEFASRMRGHGTVVVIRHDNSFRTVMKNLGKIEAKEGQDIRRGDAIGFVASTGDRIGKVYIETWKDDSPIDTLNWWASQDIGING